MQRLGRLRSLSESELCDTPEEGGLTKIVHASDPARRGQLVEEFHRNVGFGIDPRLARGEQCLHDEVGVPETAGGGQRLVGEHPAALRFATEAADHRQLLKGVDLCPLVAVFARDRDRFVAVGDGLLGMVRFECGDPQELERDRHRREARLAGQVDAGPAQVLALFDAADTVRGVAGEAEELHSLRGRDRHAVLECGVVPLVAVPESAHREPIELETVHEPDQRVGLVVVASPHERSAEIVVLGVEAEAPLFAVGTFEGRGGGLDDDQEVFRVAGVHTRDVVELGEPLPRVLAQRVEEAVTGAGSGVIGDDHRLRDQAREIAQYIMELDTFPRSDRFGRVEREATREQREAAEHELLDRVEERIRPVDRGAQRLVTLQYGAPPAGE